MRTLSPIPLLLPVMLLAACNHGGGANDATGTNGARPSNYAGVGERETLRFTGTEPFWGGSVTGAALTYTTPENPQGTAIPVRRFAGNNGLAFTGTLNGAPFDMAVAEAACSDGMSDRRYRFTVTLKIADEVRRGCGWVDPAK